MAVCVCVCVSYGEFYIDQLQQRIDKAKLILSWVLIGEPFPVTDLSHSGGTLQPGYDSHYALVKSFHPIQESEEPTGDEIVIFNAHQVCLLRMSVLPLRASERARERERERERERATDVLNCLGHHVDSPAICCALRVHTAWRFRSRNC
jgi:hypothetical protein